MGLLNDDAKYQFLSWSFVILAPFSLLGSCLTITCMYRTRYNATNPTKLQSYHRLLLGIACMDCVLSVAMILGPLPTPVDDPSNGFLPSYKSNFNSKGNITTCSFQGFLFQVGSGSFAYSAMLMAYYVLVIRYSVSEARICKFYEPFMHLLPIGYHCGSAIIGLIWKVFNTNGPYCWVASSPLDCELYHEVVGECVRGGGTKFGQRGRGTDFFGTYLLLIPLLLWTCIILVCLLIVAITVWSRYMTSQQFVFGRDINHVNERGTEERRRRRFSLQRNDESERHTSTVLRQQQQPRSVFFLAGPSRTTAATDTSNSTSIASPANGSPPTTSSNNNQNYITASSTTTEASMMEQRMRLVITQSLLYGISFLNVMIWSTVGTILFLVGVPPEFYQDNFWLDAMAIIWFPLQGLFSFLIYIRPRYLIIRRQCRKRSRGAAPPPSSQQVTNYGADGGTSIDHSRNLSNIHNSDAGLNDASNVNSSSQMVGDSSQLRNHRPRDTFYYDATRWRCIVEAIWYPVASNRERASRISSLRNNSNRNVAVSSGTSSRNMVSSSRGSRGHGQGISALHGGQQQSYESGHSGSASGDVIATASEQQQQHPDATTSTKEVIPSKDNTMPESAKDDNGAELAQSSEPSSIVNKMSTISEGDSRDAKSTLGS